MGEISYGILTRALCPAVEELLEICFPDMPPEDQYDVEDLLEMADIFPEGTIVAQDGERVIGMGTGIFLTFDFYDLPPTENDLLYQDGRTTHDPDGRYYYGGDMAVHPDFRGRRIGRAIYDRRKALVRSANREGFAAAGVLPGYQPHKGKLTIHDYVDQVVAGKLYDPTLTMQLRNGFEVIRLIPEFFTFPRSDNWSALIYWQNPDYRAG